MYNWLRGHPQVFMPARKEPCFFCTDLDSGSADDGVVFIRDERTYLANFRGAGPEQRLGEACPWYLRSADAAAAIQRRNPAALILVQLRDPVEMMHSLHALRIATGAESETDFARALTLESERAQGRRLPPRPRNLQVYQYRSMARYGEQLARYLAVFPHQQVKVILFDDLLSDTPRVFAETLGFLGVDQGYRPDFEAHSPSRRVRSTLLREALRGPLAIRLARRLVPERFRLPVRAAALRIYRHNIVPTPRQGPNPTLRAELLAELRPQLEQLSELLGRDVLSLWAGGAGRIDARRAIRRPKLDAP